MCKEEMEKGLEQMVIREWGGEDGMVVGSPWSMMVFGKGGVL